MATDAKDIYSDTVRHLPPKERLRLAAMILDDLAIAAEFSDTWSEQDAQDLAAFSLSYSNNHESNEEAS